MADAYEKQKVPDLKKLLKDRGIPGTGLTRKAQYIAKLLEYDAQNIGDAAPAEDQNASADDVTIAGDTQPAENSPGAAQSNAASTTSSITFPADEPQIRGPTPETIPQTAPPPIEPTIEPTSETVPEAPVEPPASSLQDDAPISPRPHLRAESSVLTTPIPTQEIVEDNRKRKRRSVTPPVDGNEMAIKKQKQEDATDPDVSFTEATEAEAENAAPPTKSEEVGLATTSQGDEKSEEQEDIVFEDAPETQKTEEQAPRKQSTTKDVRYKSLFNAGRPADPALQTPIEDASAGLPPAEDAIHRTTRALYICNFQRPLVPSTLRQHLISVSGTSVAEDVIENLHLDQVRTHAFVLFSDVSYAIRARGALHNRVWPAERDRKQLWVDFIPEEKVSEWIDQETNDDGTDRTGGRRWVVAYEKTDDGTMEASLVESGDRRASHQVSGPPINIPTGPRSMNPVSAHPASRAVSGANVLPAPSLQPGPNTDASFQTLGTLFLETTTKPKIFWKTVDTKIAADRKAEFKDQTSRDWTTKDWDENDLMRFTFEDGHKLVHSGKHSTSGRVRAREDHIVMGRSGPPPSAPRGEWGGGGGGYRGGFRGGRRGGYRGDYGGNSYRP